MNPSEFARKLSKVNEDTIRSIGVEAVHENEAIVISDAIVSNAEGLTFAGNDIKSNPPFGDWEETGEFHDNLKFRDKTDIEFTSRGAGWEAINEAFSFEDTAAPTAKILSREAKDDITKSYVKIQRKIWQAN